VPKLVNLGSLCIDNVYSVAGITQAGETVASASHQIFPGGKGLNQSLAAAKAGARVAHFGCAGTDGQFLIDELVEGGVDVKGIRVIDGAACGHAVIQVTPHGENAIVIAGGANRLLAATDFEHALAALEGGDWLLLQNEINDLDEVLRQAYARNVHVALNLAPVDGREQTYDLSGLQLLIVNEIEATAIAGTADPRSAASEIRTRFPATDLVLTLGRRGLIYRGREGASSLSAFRVTAVAEPAAGDAVIGYFMASLLAGNKVRDALADGSAAGALAVTRHGAATSLPRSQEVADFRRARPRLA